MLQKLVILNLLFLSMAKASTPENAISMVPRGKLVEQVGRDFVIKTEAGTKIHIEFERTGKFEEAKGLNLNKGDYLEPGEGLISLSSAARSLVAKGFMPQGAWMLDYDSTHGWVYEMENALIDAKTGKILNEKELPKIGTLLSAE